MNQVIPQQKCQTRIKFSDLILLKGGSYVRMWYMFDLNNNVCIWQTKYSYYGWNLFFVKMVKMYRLKLASGGQFNNLKLNNSNHFWIKHLQWKTFPLRQHTETPCMFWWLFIANKENKVLFSKLCPCDTAIFLALCKYHI